MNELKIELRKSIRQIYKDTKKEDIRFEVVFIPENVEDTLKLKELEEIRKEMQIDGSYNDEWKESKFIILLS